MAAAIPDDNCGHWPVLIVQSRYGGAYEGGEWHAMANCHAGFTWSIGYFEYMHDDDDAALRFWGSEEAKLIGVGSTPDEAFADLRKRHASKETVSVGHEPKDFLTTGEMRILSGDYRLGKEGYSPSPSSNL